MADLEAETTALRQRLATESLNSKTLADLAAARRAEAEALREALVAAGASARARDEVIAEQRRLIETLKRRGSPLWKRLADVLIGIGIGALAR